jgi:non-specific serine/threonine protein kinase
MNFLNELIAAYQADKLQLSTLLDVLASRGAQPESIHREEVALVQRLGDEGSLSSEAVEALSARLRSLQGSTSRPAVADDDATVIQPSAAGSRAAPDDATVVQAGGTPPIAAGDDDATVIQPASVPRAGPDDEATMVKPA